MRSPAPLIQARISPASSTSRPSTPTPCHVAGVVILRRRFPWIARTRGRWSVRLERDAKSAENISSLTKAISIDFAGDRVELRGFLRLEGVSGFAGLWLRQDGDGPGLAFDNMQQRQLKGTHPWAEYSIVLPLHPEANDLVFGVLISGTGKVWADDLQLFVDGKPIH
jgi:hypothetical protein